jgi:hypothetical protein
VSATVSPAGRSRCRRRTPTTARTAEQSHATSSAPLAPASSAALATAESPTTGPARGVNAASAAMSAAVCAAALATASAPMSTAATPASSTNPVNASPMRVAPPRSSAGQPRHPVVHGPRRSSGALLSVGRDPSGPALGSWGPGRGSGGPGLDGSVAGRASPGPCLDPLGSAVAAGGPSVWAPEVRVRPGRFERRWVGGPPRRANGFIGRSRSGRGRRSPSVGLGVARVRGRRPRWR